MKVFIVDDSPNVCQGWEFLIGAIEGVELVGQASSAPAAIAAIPRLKPDVVLLDLNLAGSSGLNVLEAIKKDEAAPVVIALTACPYPEYRRRCRAAGPIIFFDKITESDRVIKLLRQWGVNLPIAIAERKRCQHDN